jgi:hypothetical protein
MMDLGRDDVEVIPTNVGWGPLSPLWTRNNRNKLGKYETKLRSDPQQSRNGRRNRQAI